MSVELLEALAAGGDVAAIVLVGVVWRFDRRVLKLEEWRKAHEQR